MQFEIPVSSRFCKFVNKAHNFGIAFDKWNNWPIEEGRAASKSPH
jgi:hypothetical protein